MLRWKTAVVLLMSLWLPLQGMAAVVMPFCQHSLNGQRTDVPAAQSHSAHANHHAHAVHAGHDIGGSTHAKADSAPLLSACDNCGQCHLSCAFTLPSPAFPEADRVSFAAPSFVQELPRGVVPRRLHPPPLPALI